MKPKPLKKNSSRNEFTSENFESEYLQVFKWQKDFMTSEHGNSV